MKKTNYVIMGYNRGSGYAELSSWPTFLKLRNPATNDLVTSGMKYSIKIRKDAGFPLRTYFWKDQDLFVDPANPTAPPVLKDFCFKYDEVEWFGGATWNTARSQALTITQSGTSTCP